MIGIGNIISAVGNGLDKLFTSEDEKNQAKITLAQLEQQPHLLQAMINVAEARHKNLFVAGWRPWIGWVCGFSLAYEFLLRPILMAFGLPMVNISSTELMPLVLGMLGLGGMRSFDKLKGTSPPFNGPNIPPPDFTNTKSSTR